ncbi:LOW QUALITY PROTEIN: hypothetical protein NC653_030565 [Populus alba x Populus x berolinensis]|uniref:Uncharacterized protein n=1 Tax=Populus alba x Populus x berolinensis TaxID=444605 RepID=A0AAD6LWA5_9ROSI|nr:LOW QUALITY PROTEIN: hypothetical protein NC653_030565 [Populus alba x Populus x berolinensis]
MSFQQAHFKMLSKQPSKSSSHAVITERTILSPFTKEYRVLTANSWHTPIFGRFSSLREEPKSGISKQVGDWEGEFTRVISFLQNKFLIYILRIQELGAPTSIKSGREGKITVCLPPQTVAYANFWRVLLSMEESSYNCSSKLCLISCGIYFPDEEDSWQFLFQAFLYRIELYKAEFVKGRPKFSTASKRTE